MVARALTLVIPFGDPKLRLLPNARLELDLAPIAPRKRRPSTRFDEGRRAVDDGIAGSGAELVGEVVSAGLGLRQGRADIVVTVAVLVVAGGGFAAEEIKVDLPGEGEVGGNDAKVELEVGPDGGDGVGPCVCILLGLAIRTMRGGGDGNLQVRSLVTSPREEARAIPKPVALERYMSVRI